MTFDYWTALEDETREDITVLVRCICGLEKRINKGNLKKGTTKSCGCKLQEIRKKTCLEKYGVENYIQTKEFREKVKQTCLEKYGETHSSKDPEVYNKKKQTWLKKYGVDSPLKCEEIKEKVKQTCLEKYGKTNPMKVDEFKEKGKQTCVERYGETHPLKNTEIVKKSKKTIEKRYNGQHYMCDPVVKKKYYSTLLARYGVNNTSKIQSISKKKIDTRLLHQNIHQIGGRPIIEICKEYNVLFTHALKIFKQYGEEAFLEYCNKGPKTSSLEVSFALLMKNHFPNLSHYNAFPKKGLKYKPDFKIDHNGKTLFINLDGLYWHSLRHKEKQYHLNVRTAFEKNDLTIFQFREDELRDRPEIVKSIVLNYFGIHEKKINARQCIVKGLSQEAACKFLNENHLMGFSSGRMFGLYLNEELVSVMVVKMKNKILDIVRFSNRNNYSVRGGFSKLLSHVEKILQPKTIQSFCDLRYSQGKSYNLLGFEDKGTTLGWNWTDFEKTFNRLRCRANMDNRRLNQEEHARELGWHKIYDAGQRKYIK